MANGIDERKVELDENEVYFERKYKELNEFNEREELENTLKDLRGKHDGLIVKCQNRKKEINFMKDKIKELDDRLEH